MHINLKIKIMKTWILAIVMMMGFAMNAQHGERRHNEKRHGKEHTEHFTPEQKAELQAKKMTLALDLSDKQQADVKAFLLERNKEKQKQMETLKANREAGKKLTSDDRFAMNNRRLDDKLAMKAFMKKTLDARQLSKLEEMKKHRHEKITKKNDFFKNARRR